MLFNHLIINTAGMRSIVFKALLVLFVFNTNNLVAQNSSETKIDSLKQILVKADTKDLDKINSYIRLAQLLIREDTDLAIDYVGKAKLLAENTGNVTKVAISLIELARLKEVQNDFIGSITSLDEAERLYEDLDVDNTIITIHSYQGMYYEMLSNYDMAIEKQLLALKMAVTIDNQQYQAVSLSNLSHIYTKANQFEKSLEAILESNAIYNEIGTRGQYYQSLINTGGSYLKLKKYDLAKSYLDKAKVYFTEKNDHILLANIYNDLAKISTIRDNQNRALELLLIAQYHGLEMKDYNGEQNYKLALINNSLGNTYLYFENYKKAIQVFRSSQGIGEQLKSTAVLRDAYKGLVDSYAALRNTDSISHYLNLFVPVNESLLEEQYNEKIDALNYEYQLDIEKNNFEKDKALMEVEKEGQKLFFTSVVSILALIVLVILFFLYALKSKFTKSSLLSHNLKLEKENLSIGLERKNKELTTSVLNLIERNKFISKISEDLESIKTISNVETQKSIQNILRDIDRGSTKQLWKEFEMRYIEVHKAFFQALNSTYPNLTANDRKLCALIKLNMSSKDISSITYQSVQSIKVARYRLRKKLGIGKNENLSSFLNNL